MSLASIADLLDGPTVGYGLPPGWAGGGGDLPTQAEAPTASPGAAPRLSVSVVWGDLVRQPADIHVVGHYQGVLPTGSEGALDRAISGSTGPGLITEHTRRRWLLGSLGEITYFPGRKAVSSASVIHRVAVAGMGRPGTFRDSNAAQLYASLLHELGALPDVSTIAMALIGAGSANLTIPQSARAVMRGFAAAVTAADPARFPDVMIVEHDRLRAERLSVALASIPVPNVEIRSNVEVGAGGTVDSDSAAIFAVRAVAQAIRQERSDTAENTAASALRRSLATTLPAQLRELIIDQLAGITDDIEGLEVHVGRSALPAGSAPPTRISVTQHEDTDTMSWAALTGSATVPERQVPLQHELVSDLTSRLTAPSREDGERLAPMLRRWVVPVDFQPHVSAGAPLVLEVNGPAARLPWEFLTDEPFERGDEGLPFALRIPVARQLRTTYAKATGERDENDRLTALVIADPGAAAQSLAGARKEGLEVAQLLRDRGVRTTLYVGSPDNPPPAGERAATRLDVLNELLTGRFDIVHFAGHGIMPEPQRPELAGWLFSDGLLAARELVQLTSAPRLVMANACWTAAGLGSAANALPASVGKAQLTAVLAEEFLRAGVTHFIGTSWAVPDSMARMFATAVYSQVVPLPGNVGDQLGFAIMQARRALYADLPADKSDLSPEELYAWAAYQHYGDPVDVLYRLYSPDTGDGAD